MTDLSIRTGGIYPARGILFWGAYRSTSGHPPDFHRGEELSRNEIESMDAKKEGR